MVCALPDRCVYKLCQIGFVYCIVASLVFLAVLAYVYTPDSQLSFIRNSGRDKQCGLYKTRK
jgi:hypothetical protein